ncbi:MAG TPA: sensor histidine kinase [Streptosporangiaceae bacterium]|nr:sensor histidine kinase [Streptosporangiaceae bacterium]
MATRSSEAAPGQAGSGQAGSGQANRDWDDAVLAEARMQGIPGSGSRWRWLFSGIWLVYLIQPISALFDQHDPAWIAGGLVIAATFCAIYLPALMYVDERPRWAGAGLAALAVLAAVACVVYGEHWTPLWIYVSAAGGLILTAIFDRRVATLGVVVISGLYLISCWITHLDGADTVAVLLPVVLIGLAMIGFRMQLVLMHELGRARETVAKLAANEERLRLARDMHDLTGQSLSMITLKSELAAKRLTRLPDSAERDAILTELGDVSRVSRQTLHDIREAVSGYRRPTLAIEVITARSALEAAGIQLDDDPELTMRSGTFDPDAEAVLAWCLREAVTNVVRHSRARHCRLRLTERTGEVSLEVTDDGRGFSGPAKDSAEAAATGSGLRGISERLSAVGGHLSLGQGDTGRGFRLTATVPAATAAGHNCQL